ncbi:unnamed protein product [Rhizoctonia solani]|uniref:Cutinase n=1 Tax=Rhizoctonia solani TaxID=456999 RepID=A0A8H2X930_9AGAM|nr:unnamed protein product [Rhizoctonia solani]
MFISDVLLCLFCFALSSSALRIRPSEEMRPSEEISSSACSDLQLVFLVGATETRRPGNVGGPLSKALALAVPGTTTYSVPYDNRFRFKTSLLKGAAMTVDYLILQAARCPEQCFVIGGYSKGSLIIHSMNLPPYLKAQVVAIVVFGDPLHGVTPSWPITSPVVNLDPRFGFKSGENVASFCNKYDVVCRRRGLNILAHWIYGKEKSIDAAVRFIKTRFEESRKAPNLGEAEAV